MPGHGRGLGVQPGLGAARAALPGAVRAGQVKMDRLELAEPGAAGGAQRAARQVGFTARAAHSERRGAQPGRIFNRPADLADRHGAREAGDLQLDGMGLGRV